MWRPFYLSGMIVGGALLIARPPQTCEPSVTAGGARRMIGGLMSTMSAMCTNYRATRSDLEQLSRQSGLDFDQGLGDWKPDIWPDYDAPALLATDAGTESVMGRYGFWPKSLQPERRNAAGKKMQPYSTYNSRSEEVGSKRLYAAAWRAGQRCLIPAAYVVEPCWETGKNVWHKCGLIDGEPFAVAGLWKRYETKDGPITGVTMLTVNAEGHAVMGRMHRPADEKRSVVLLRPADFDEWLHSTNAEAARSMLQLLPAEEMRADPILG
ncbi:SOS response-associated peptidase family protein [Paraburkholderia sp. SIMBA_054]|uniref:SOS response-associated peptidase family protein n=1 Tax=Paraburkholderia sp. SIMBA_054 TaxID=3085795 RepID=UPI003979543C